MKRLFRKIRQQLLSRSNNGIYNLYAAGEIILVVKGAEEIDRSVKQNSSD